MPSSDLLSDFHRSSLPLSAKSWRHSVVSVLQTIDVSSIPPDKHDFTRQERAIRKEVYGPIYNKLCSALDTFGHDPSRGLALLTQLRNQLTAAL